jgi:hypothetical protein
VVLSVCFIRGNEVRSVHLSFSFEVIEYFGNQAYDGRSSDQIEECMIMIVAISDYLHNCIQLGRENKKLG